VLKIKRLISIAALLTVGAAVHAPLAAASGNQEAIFQDDIQMKANPVGTLAIFRSLGVTRVRVSVTWSSLAPSSGSRRQPRSFKAADPAAYPTGNWAVYDRIVRDAAADGIALDFMLTGPAPLWATGPGMPRGGPYGQWKPSASEFRTFVQAVGTRYSGGYKPRGASQPLPRVNFWSIWNEPNYGIDLAPQATNNDTIEVGAVEYRGLLDAAWGGLLATGHGRDTILIGETAPRGVDHPIGNFSGVKPLRFLRALYCVDSSYRQLRGAAAAQRGCPTTAAGSRRFRSQHPALFQASGFADHPYTSQAHAVAPNQPTTSDPRRFKSDPDYADLPEVPRLEGVLDRLARIYGSGTRFAVWSTEYGYRSKPPDPVATINQATAAYYINWAEYLSWRQPRVASYSQYLLVDPPSGFFASGLLLANGAQTATFDAYRMPLYMPATSARRGHGLEVWGCVRPAHFAALASPAPQRVSILFQPGSKGAFATVSTVPVTNTRGYFDVRVTFPSSGAVKLAWTYPSGQTVFSRTVSVTIH
jgi:hypothetical protein